MFRGALLKKAPLTYLLVICCALISAECFSESAKRPPNIVLILADDLGYGDLGSYGATLIKTPNMDRLASAGVRLTQFYASGNVCTPSRAGLLTGRYPIRSGLAYKTLSIGDKRGLKPEELTLAKALKAYGYKTALIGKWHLGDRPEYHPFAHGFDEFYGTLYSNDEPEQALLNGHEIVEERINAQMLAVQIIDRSIEFIDSNSSGEQPFFLFLSTTSPHKPLRPSAEFVGQSQAGRYGDVVEELDAGVGEVMTALKRKGIEDNTLVIVTSDNGPFPEGSTGGLRGSKGGSWDAGYRVPFISHWPNGIESNLVSSGISMNIDLMPTLINIAAGKDEADMLELDGKDVSSLLQGGDQSPHDALYFFNNEKIAAIRTQQWRAVFWAEYLGINRWLPDHELNLLFDMNLDPAERYSVAANHPDVWQKMLDYLAEAVQELESLALYSNGN